MGVAVFPLHAKHAESLLQAADQAMYTAKVTDNAVMAYKKTRPSNQHPGSKVKKRSTAKAG